MALKIVIILFCIIMSACFSGAETAFNSFNKSKVKGLAEKGNKKAALALKLSDKYDSLSATVLVGKTIVNLLCAALTALLFADVIKNGSVALASAISTAILTLLILILAEAVPKTAAKKMPDGSAMFFAPFINVTKIILTPLTLLFNLVQSLVSKMFKSSDEKSMAEEELISIIEEAEEEGEFDKEESDLIKSAIEFNDLEVEDIFTPRIDVTAISKDSTKEEIDEVYTESGFSRLPVYDGDLDNVIGILYYKDFYTTDFGSIEEILKPVIYVAKTQKINDLMKELQEKQLHLAVVMDEFGTTAGIVTLEDVLEEIVGEIWDEHDEKIEEVKKVSDTEYIVSGKANVSKLFDELEIEEEMEAQTLTGWTMAELGKIPEEQDTFESRGLKITVLKMDGRRIESLQVIDMRERASDTEEDEKNKEETVEQ